MKKSKRIKMTGMFTLLSHFKLCSRSKVYIIQNKLSSYFPLRDENDNEFIYVYSWVKITKITKKTKK